MLKKKNRRLNEKFKGTRFLSSLPLLLSAVFPRGGGNKKRKEKKNPFNAVPEPI